MRLSPPVSAARANGLARAQYLGAELVSARGLYYEWMRSVDALKELESGARIVPPVGTIL